jgi:hypothetical protein
MALAKDAKEASQEKMKKLAKVQSTEALAHAYIYRRT